MCIRDRTMTQYEKRFPLVHQVRIPTGERRRGWYIKAGKWSFTLLMPTASKLEWDYSMEEKQLKLFSNFYLPFYLGNIEGHEMVSYERNYTRSELEALAGSIYSQFAENLEEKGVHILENENRYKCSRKRDIRNPGDRGIHCGASAHYGGGAGDDYRFRGDVT